jgi:anti-sigma regulatory factor (Ser/Thr protein kinase)
MPAQARYADTFPCSPLDARRARKAVAGFARGWLRGIDACDFESAVGEALANVVEHSGCTQIVVQCWCAGQKVTAEIWQNGTGFDVPARHHAPPRGAPRGYGLFIMQAVLDQVDFRENGTRVRLVKAIA